MTRPPRPPAGKLDRRITIEVATASLDGAGDEVKEWAPAFKLYASRSTATGPAGPGTEVPAAVATLHQAEVNFEVRYGTKALSISPELHRIIYQSRIHEILGIQEGRGRQDRIMIRTAVRPDDRGARGQDSTSDGSP